MTRYSCQILIKVEISRQIFGKSSTTKYQENPSSGSRVVPFGQTEGHDEPNSRFQQFCGRAKN
jgi:hypothetical protein